MNTPPVSYRTLPSVDLGEVLPQVFHVLRAGRRRPLQRPVFVVEEPDGAVVAVELHAPAVAAAVLADDEIAIRPPFGVVLAEEEVVVAPAAVAVDDPVRVAEPQGVGRAPTGEL
jgi:hypothetical protein